MKSLYKKRSLVLGVGINDADYTISPVVNGKRVMCPAYVVWSNMLNRCYHEKSRQSRKTYEDCYVDPEWHSFMSFKAWYDANHVEGWQLDKDLLFLGNKKYGPDTCIFVPKIINCFMLDRGNGRGDFPLGVSRNHKRFQSSINIRGEYKYLGTYDTPEEAHNAWKEAKREQVILMKEELDNIDKRLFPSILQRYE